jgi:hypothetical protein
MTVSAGTIAVMDNSMPGYAETGEGWSTASNTGDFYGSHREHAAGGDATAT